MDDYKESRSSMGSEAAAGGLLLGSILALFTLINYAMGNNGNSWLSSLMQMAIVIGIVSLTIQYRNQVRGGKMTYLQSVRFGVLLMFFSFAFPGALLFVLSTFDPRYLEENMRQSFEQMSKIGFFKGAPADTYDKSLKLVTNPLVLLFSSMMSGALIGLIISLFTSLFTRKE